MNFELCKPYSMAMSGERAEFLYDTVYRQVKEQVPGDFVECGVWKGGNCMLMALALQELGENRTIWMYDTYQGMPTPGEEDVTFDGDRKAKDIWHEGWCEASFEEVLANMQSVNAKNYKMIAGKVQNTIPKHAPESISILRLDTDFYASTKHELFHLYPRLSIGGILIMDDYYKWKGSRKACDEFLPNKLFTRIGTSNAAWALK